MAIAVPSHSSHSISVYCINTSANYCNIFAYLRITSGDCLNLYTWVQTNLQNTRNIIMHCKNFSTVVSPECKINISTHLHIKKPSKVCETGVYGSKWQYEGHHCGNCGKLHKICALVFPFEAEILLPFVDYWIRQHLCMFSGQLHL